MIRMPLATLVALLPTFSAAADAPPVGTTLTLSVISVSAGGSDRELRRAVYAPPPGWYVRSHQVAPTRKAGAVMYAVNTVPAGWAWRAEDQTAAQRRSSAAAAVTAYKMSAGGQAALDQSMAASGLHSGASSHHVLVLEVSVRGPGLWRGESGVGLTVVAELVYLGK